MNCTETDRLNSYELQVTKVTKIVLSEFYFSEIRSLNIITYHKKKPLDILSNGFLSVTVLQNSLFTKSGLLSS